MYRSLTVLTVLLSAASLACSRTSTEPSWRAVMSSSVLRNSVGGTPVTTVEIKSENLAGTLPNGVVRTLVLKAQVQGTDPSSLAGEGRHFAITGAHHYWNAAGATDGTSATLTGIVTESTGPFLGSPVQVVGNASTGAVSLTFGPLVGGPFAGQTLFFTGTGRVTVGTRD